MLGPGIKVNMGNVAKIKGNTVMRSKNGVECISNQATVVMNNLISNYECGVVTESK